ncbi:methyltransferase domain-containing protein [Stigmatella sp. ncwal1]|uniref:Methyltransferase domain-containing protein n=1 Tax=Stigmatella ashevillensis TaxID=2995309 RepID=A0ABT5D2W1_9BACT|nr:methyltransferase domain-containing protein [Stigmatella ashevillena]MDC0708012.1 methyltransferase domain-containing protein [Stigmatella ashevillena]
MNVQDLHQIVCSDCRGRLAWKGQQSQGHLSEGALTCERCNMRWPVTDGLPRLYREGQVRGTDRLMRVIYDGLPSLHDPMTFLLTPVLQATTEARLREGYLHRLELRALRPRPDGQPLRLLEIGIGSGANLPLIERELPPGLDIELWGMDLSQGMLAECRKRISKKGHRGVRLLMGDAHTLPFADHSFDRVFEIGGVGGYHNPRRALEEMARVARPDTPIVVVDEQLDPTRPHSLATRAAFRLLTFYTRDAHCPRELLPPEATGVLAEQITRFYYCLTFRTRDERSLTAVG